MKYKERTYRNRVDPAGLVSYQVMVKETDLWISAERELKEESRDIIVEYHAATQNPADQTQLRRTWQSLQKEALDAIREMVALIFEETD